MKPWITFNRIISSKYYLLKYSKTAVCLARPFEERWIDIRRHTKAPEVPYDVKVLDAYQNIEPILKNVNPEEVIVTISTKKFDQIRGILETCEREQPLRR